MGIPQPISPLPWPWSKASRTRSKQGAWGHATAETSWHQLCPHSARTHESTSGIENRNQPSVYPPLDLLRRDTTLPLPPALSNRAWADRYGRSERQVLCTSPGRNQPSRRACTQTAQPGPVDKCSANWQSLCFRPYRTGAVVAWYGFVPDRFCRFSGRGWTRAVPVVAYAVERTSQAVSWSTQAPPPRGRTRTHARWHILFAATTSADLVTHPRGAMPAWDIPGSLVPKKAPPGRRLASSRRHECHHQVVSWWQTVLRSTPLVTDPYGAPLSNTIEQMRACLGGLLVRQCPFCPPPAWLPSITHAMPWPAAHLPSLQTTTH